MWEKLFSAFALLLVFEGITPFLSPDRWRDMLQRAMQLNNRTLRVIGLISMLIGVVVLYFLHWHEF